MVPALYRGNRIEKMSILHYFKPTISLPNLNGLSKEEIKPTTIQKVNEKVLPLIERQKIGSRGLREPYTKLTPVQKALIGQRAAESHPPFAIFLRDLTMLYLKKPQFKG